MNISPNKTKQFFKTNYTDENAFAISPEWEQ